MIVESDVTLCVRYHSSRREIWHWYWRTWRQPRGLWRIHAVIALGAFVTVLLLIAPPVRPIPWIYGIWAVLAALLSVAWLPLWPMIRFKPQLRTLEVSRRGLRTSVGKLTGEKSWREIASIEEACGCICIEMPTSSAFLVPERAFPSAIARNEFLRSIQDWHAGRNR